ncbi:MAG TPA: endonuclease NucS domain-containing protein, partial [Burkholderiales bacterium]|nr:endonuclease NucS domain-containing protein [Burkholderiales bacterium]
MTEDELRDRLALDISIIESGLTLLGKEQFIPNAIGTSSFIDLYARDSKGHHVLIELKRSDSAAREAIHEVQKYVEGVKQHLAVRDNEIRVIIASTEWRELLVPFSRFKADTNLAIDGVQIQVKASGEISTTSVSPLDTMQGRYLAPWHELNFYLDKESLNRGLEEYRDCCRTKGIENYVLVILSAPNEPIQSEGQLKRISVLQMLSQANLGNSNPVPEIP